MKQYFLIFLVFLVGCADQEQSNQVLSKPPLAPIGSVVENYWGVDIEDPYRNLEDLNDPAVQKWFKDQSDYSNDLFQNISGREKLIEKMEEYDARETYKITHVSMTENDEYFYLKQKPEEKRAKLYFRKSYDADEEFLYDPQSFKPHLNNEYLINFVKPNWDGSYVVVALTFGGSEVGEMIIIDMKTRETLSQIVPNCWPSGLGGVSWLADNKSFIYTHLPVVDPKSNLFLINMKVVFYKVGDDPERLNVILGAENNPALKLNSEDIPVVILRNKNDEFLIGKIWGATAYCDAFYAKISELKTGSFN